MGPRTFLTVWAFLWYNCSAPYGSSAWWLYAGTNRDLIQEDLCHTLSVPGLLQPEFLSPWQATADPCLRRRQSNTQRQVWLSLCVVSGFWCAQGFVWALQASLEGMGFDSKCGLHNIKCLCKLPFYLIIYDKYFLVSLNIHLKYIFLVAVDKYLCKLPFFFPLRYSLENSIKLKTVWCFWYTLSNCLGLFWMKKLLLLRLTQSLTVHNSHHVLRLFLQIIIFYFRQSFYWLASYENFMTNQINRKNRNYTYVEFSSVQSLSRVRLFATPWLAARQASLSITNSRSSLRLTSIESVMPSSHLIFCIPFSSCP